MPITKLQAITAKHGQIFLHMTAKNADGSPLRCRVNGESSVWKTRPAEFKLPVKYGLRECFYITNENADEWCTEANWQVESELFRGVK